MKSVRFTKAAEEEIEAIGDYIAETNPMRAVDFVRALRGKCLDLADMAERFQLVARYADAGVRRRVHGDYLILYRVESRSIEILHVLHGAMDVQAFLEADL